MEVIITDVNGNKLSYEQNAEGKYNIEIIHHWQVFRTGFIFDSIKLLNKYQLRVSQTDSEGNKKWGMISVCSGPILPCCFDKLKPYQAKVAQAFIGEEEYRIDSCGRVYSREFWEMRNS